MSHAADEGLGVFSSAETRYGSIASTSEPVRSTVKAKTGPTGPVSDEIQLSTVQLATVLGSTYLGILLAALDGTMVATLTASISSTFTSATLLAWIASAYFIANSVLQPISGKLTDIYGRATGLIFCHVLFCIGNLVCAVAQSEAVFILGRVIAGLGGGGLNAIPLFVTNDLVPLRRRGVWQGFNNICFGLGSGLGGVFGGWLNDTVGWRWAFIALVPMTIVSGLLVTMFLKTPKDQQSSDTQDKWKSIDLTGSFVLVTAIVLLLVALNSGGNIIPWPHPLIAIALAISLLLFGLLGYVESYIAIEPVIPITLLLDRTVLSACLTSWFFSMAQIALTFYAPIFFQVQGKSAKQAGLLLIPTSVGAALGGIITGIAIKRLGTYYLLNIIVQLCFLVPLGLATRFRLDTPILYPIIYFFLTGLAYAGKLTITVTAVIAAVEQKHQAVVTSASYAFRGTGSTIGIALCSLVFQNILKTQLWRRFGDKTEAATIVGRLRDNMREIWMLPHKAWVVQAEEAYMSSLRGVFWTIFILGSIGTLASLFMREHVLHRNLARTDSQ